jgi:hypothetical protein
VCFSIPYVYGWLNRRHEICTLSIRLCLRCENLRNICLTQNLKHSQPYWGPERHDPSSHTIFDTFKQDLQIELMQTALYKKHQPNFTIFSQNGSWNKVLAYNITQKFFNLYSIWYALSKAWRCLRHNLRSQLYGSKSLVRSTGSAVWNL